MNTLYPCAVALLALLYVQPVKAALIVPTPQVGVFAVSNNGIGAAGPTVNQTRIGAGPFPTPLFVTSLDPDPTPGTPGYAAANAQASYGVLRALATAHNSIGVVATATASASFADSILFSDPAWNGLAGTARAYFRVSGSYFLDSTHPLTLATANLGVTWDAYKPDNTLVSNYYRNFVGRSNGVNDGTLESVTRIHEAIIPFTWGEAFIFQLAVGVGATASDVSSAGISVATGDMSHTLVWQGMDVFDPTTGGLASGFSTSSLSGTNWLEPASVPEPGSIALVGLGGIALCLTRRLRKS
jgi:hypothetical protein